MQDAQRLSVDYCDPNLDVSKERMKSDNRHAHDERCLSVQALARQPSRRRGFTGYAVYECMNDVLNLDRIMFQDDHVIPSK